MTSRSSSSLLSAAALVATFACARLAHGDSNASRSASVTPAYHATLPPIVPLEAMLGMSTLAGVVGLVLSRRRA